LGVGVGCIGLSHDDFCRLYPEEFESIYNAWKERTDADTRSNWEQMRMLATIVIQPHVRKRITPKQLLPLPWDDEDRRTKTTSEDDQLTSEQKKQRFEALAKSLSDCK
jgi:hypothetical protein